MIVYLTSCFTLHLSIVPLTLSLLSPAFPTHVIAGPASRPCSALPAGLIHLDCPTPILTCSSSANQPLSICTGPFRSALQHTISCFCLTCLPAFGPGIPSLPLVGFVCLYDWSPGFDHCHCRAFGFYSASTSERYTIDLPTRKIKHWGTIRETDRNLFVLM